jgi:putative ABC transport system permease protein
MLRDFRFAFRVLTARPVFTLVAALSLALGIGANSAIFGLVDALWFRPLAVPKPGEIVRIFSVTDQDREGLLSYPEYLDLKQRASSLRELVAIGGRGAILEEGNSRELHDLNLVSSNFFTALGVQPVLGRLFTPQDEADPSAALVVVLGNRFWERHYGRDPNIIGKQIRIARGHNDLYTVIGVLPRSFRAEETASDRDLWFSRQAWARLGDVQELESRGNRWFRVLGRLAPGVTERSANAQVEAISARMAEAWPATNKGRRAAVMSDLHYRMQQAGANGAALLAIVLLLVMISSVNVANLLLSRAGVRGKEMAVRLALGAGRGRLIRQLMAENLLLGIAGLVLGVFIGAWLIALLPALMVQPPGFQNVIDFEFDARVFAFSLTVSVATVVLFGLAPAWKSARPDLVPALKGEAAFASPAHGRWPLRNWLVVAEVALSLVLLASAGVLVRSFANTRSSDLGFSRKHLLLVWLSVDDPKVSRYQDILDRFAAIPGVRSVAGAVRAPLSLSSNGMFQRVMFPGRTEYASAPPFEIKYNSVTRNFLNTMGTPILRGRGFEQHDETAGANSVIINETMAQRFWPNDDPVGRTVLIGGPKGRVHRIIGVAKNAPINAVGEAPEPYLYLAYWPNIESEITYLIETSADPTALAPTARQVLKSVDSHLDPLTITTENELIRYSAQTYEVTAELVGALGLLGLFLCAVGLYGVVSFGVSQRTRELGIRMALGAGRNDTLRLVLREVATLGAIGIAIGLPLALTATQLMSKLLFGLGPWDPVTFLVSGILLAAVLALAGFLPARRATGIEPSVALRTT